MSPPESDYQLIPGSDPPRYGPNRMGLCFQFDPSYPGTLEQQATLRDLFSTEQPTPYLHWYFARAYKAYWAKELGLGQRNTVVVSVNGTRNMAFAISMLLNQNEQGRDLQLVFAHEWGHLFDRYCLTSQMRTELMGMAGDLTKGNWAGYDLNYFDRPAEQFAFSFQRLVMPGLAPHTWYTTDMLEVLPDFEAAFKKEMSIDIRPGPG